MVVNTCGQQSRIVLVPEKNAIQWYGGDASVNINGDDVTITDQATEMTKIHQ